MSSDVLQIDEKAFNKAVDRLYHKLPTKPAVYDGARVELFKVFFFFPLPFLLPSCFF
jgi:hypothetical protein